MRFSFLRPLALTAALLLAGAEAGAATPSCQAELGDARSAQLVNQCILVSPATRPPCNAANSCQMIEGEILRSCALLEGKAPAFCGKPARSGTYEGYLVGGGGIDNSNLLIRLDDGRRIDAWCGACGDWFGEADENDLRDLKPAYLGKRVRVVVKVQRNGGGLAGPGEDDMEPFIKSVQFLK
jgi:hypothetical protein